MSKKTNSPGILVRMVSEDNFFLNLGLEIWLPLCGTLIGASENLKKDSSIF